MNKKQIIISTIAALAVFYVLDNATWQTARQVTGTFRETASVTAPVWDAPGHATELMATPLLVQLGVVAAAYGIGLWMFRAKRLMP
jgi:hypothetical protein